MGRKLHIGGEVRAPGWEVLNAMPADYVDHLGNAMDLSKFPDGTFSDVYASHIAEHFDFTGQIQSDMIGVGRGLLHEIPHQLEMMKAVTGRTSMPDEKNLTWLFMKSCSSANETMSSNTRSVSLRDKPRNDAFR